MCQVREVFRRKWWCENKTLEESTTYRIWISNHRNVLILGRERERESDLKRIVFEIQVWKMQFIWTWKHTIVERVHLNIKPYKCTDWFWKKERFETSCVWCEFEVQLWKMQQGLFRKVCATELGPSGACEVPVAHVDTCNQQGGLALKCWLWKIVWLFAVEKWHCDHAFTRYKGNRGVSSHLNTTLCLCRHMIRVDVVFHA